MSYGPRVRSSRRAPADATDTLDQVFGTYEKPRAWARRKINREQRKYRLRMLREAKLAAKQEFDLQENPMHDQHRNIDGIGGVE